MKVRNVLLFLGAATVLLAGNAAAQNAQADAGKGDRPTAEQSAKAEEAARKAAEARAKANANANAKAKADAGKSRTGDAEEEEENDR